MRLTWPGFLPTPSTMRALQFFAAPIFCLQLVAAFRSSALDFKGVTEARPQKRGFMLNWAESWWLKYRFPRVFFAASIHRWIVVEFAVKNGFQRPQLYGGLAWKRHGMAQEPPEAVTCAVGNTDESGWFLDVGVDVSKSWWTSQKWVELIWINHVYNVLNSSKPKPWNHP